MQEWETLNNENFKSHQMVTFRLKAPENKNVITPKSYISETNAIGLISRAGKNGGTYEHRDIALNFCYWISPKFQVYFIRAFQKLIEREFERQNLEWHISRITDNVDELRNLLDTIPYQNPKHNRLNPKK